MLKRVMGILGGKDVPRMDCRSKFERIQKGDFANGGTYR